MMIVKLYKYVYCVCTYVGVAVGERSNCSDDRHTDDGRTNPLYDKPRPCQPRPCHSPHYSQDRMGSTLPSTVHSQTELDSSQGR
jgi:hypothetical protein